MKIASFKNIAKIERQNGKIEEYRGIHMIKSISIIDLSDMAKKKKKIESKNSYEGNTLCMNHTLDSTQIKCVNTN